MILLPFWGLSETSLGFDSKPNAAKQFYTGCDGSKAWSFGKVEAPARACSITLAKNFCTITSELCCVNQCHYFLTGEAPIKVDLNSSKAMLKKQGKPEWSFQKCINTCINKTKAPRAGN